MLQHAGLLCFTTIYHKAITLTVKFIYRCNPRWTQNNFDAQKIFDAIKTVVTFFELLNHRDKLRISYSEIHIDDTS